MKTDKLIQLCRLYENTSKAGRKYYVGNLSFSAKILLLQDMNAKDGEPAWVLYVSEREPKPAGDVAGRDRGQKPT